ncbi:MAG TPA: hypothetical protein VK428_04590 [Acidimicrobiales bacterium]|nr:hypothetical protein [Acidimicrobiales bacterium]
MRRHTGGLVAAILVPLLTVPIVTSPPAAGSGPVLPSQDPFYRYTGSVPLSEIPPGTVLKSRSVDLALDTLTSTPGRQSSSSTGRPTIRASPRSR